MQTFTHNPKSELAPSSFEKTTLPDLLFLSHLRWTFTPKQPQNLLQRWARERRVFFVEQPLYLTPSPSRALVYTGMAAHVLLKPQRDHLIVVTPCLRAGSSPAESIDGQKRILDNLMDSYGVGDYLLWYDTPDALAFTRHLAPRGVIYDFTEQPSQVEGSFVEEELSTRH